MDRRLAAILVADVVGYAKLSRIDEEGTRARFLSLLHGVFEPGIARHHGRLVKTMGDGLLVEFSSVVNALRCAIEVQQQLGAKSAGGADEQLQFRIGINLGDVIAEGSDVQGDGVNIADRLQSLADPNGIVISGSAYEQVRNKIDVGIESLGNQRLKNIDEAIAVYRVRSDKPRQVPRRSITLPKRWAATFAAVAALIVAIGLWNFYGGIKQTALATPAVAVLPFNNLSSDPVNARLAEGLRADLITDLSRYWDFAVIAKDSADKYKGEGVDVRQIGRELNVSHVLEGSFQHEGDQVRITVQLIDAMTGKNIWTERYDRPAGEVFAIQSEVADKITNTLGGAGGLIAGNVLAAAKRKRPADLGAYELYLLSREKMLEFNLASELEAQKLLHQALQIDPKFARAYALLAWTYAWRMTMETGTEKFVQLMLEAARHAVDLDPMDADAREALGYAHALAGDLQQAKVQFNEALRLNPNSFDILTVYACWAHSFDDAKEGAEAVTRAMRLNPNYPPWSVACFRTGLAMDGRYEEVVKTQDHQPEGTWNADGFVFTAGSLAKLGRVDDAKAMATRGVSMYPGLLSIEKFALNRNWAPKASLMVADLMREAGFPTCAKDDDLKDVTKPVRLPECVKD